MTTITAKIVADSKSPNGVRIITMELVYPRFIHAEFMTHRQFSRNASSSRAIPVERQIRAIEEDPAVPLYWGKNQKGMQAGEEWDARIVYIHSDTGVIDNNMHREEAWLMAKQNAVDMAKAFAAAGYHKQIVNRLLEPFSHIRVLVTATEWANFFSLRLHADAEPHIQHLARQMASAITTSESVTLSFGSWHLPYVDPFENEGLTIAERVKISVARCARVSYLTHESKAPRIDEDLALYDRLIMAKPMHASPAEHQAFPDRQDMQLRVWSNSHMHGNFIGWCQNRKVLEQQGAIS